MYAELLKVLYINNMSTILFVSQLHPVLLRVTAGSGGPYGRPGIKLELLCARQAPDLPYYCSSSISVFFLI